MNDGKELNIVYSPMLIDTCDYEDVYIILGMYYGKECYEMVKKHILAHGNMSTDDLLDMSQKLRIDAQYKILRGFKRLHPFKKHDDDDFIEDLLIYALARLPFESMVKDFADELTEEYNNGELKDERDDKKFKKRKIIYGG
jgi:hypothetical protein